VAPSCLTGPLIARAGCRNPAIRCCDCNLAKTDLLCKRLFYTTLNRVKRVSWIAKNVGTKRALVDYQTFLHTTVFQSVRIRSKSAIGTLERGSYARSMLLKTPNQADFSQFKVEKGNTRIRDAEFPSTCYDQGAVLTCILTDGPSSRAKRSYCDDWVIGRVNYL